MGTSKQSKSEEFIDMFEEGGIMFIVDEGSEERSSRLAYTACLCWRFLHPNIGTYGLSVSIKKYNNEHHLKNQSYFVNLG